MNPANIIIGILIACLFVLAVRRVLKKGHGCEGCGKCGKSTCGCKKP